MSDESGDKIVNVEVIQLNIEEDDDPKEDGTLEDPDTESAKTLFSKFQPDSDASNFQPSESEGPQSAGSDDSDEPLSRKVKKIKVKKYKTKDSSNGQGVGSTKKYTQKFKREWLQIPSAEMWLCESTKGDIYFYCTFCKKDCKCTNGKSEVIKHMSSIKHKRNSSEQESNMLGNMVCPTDKEKKKMYWQKYKKEWERIPQVKPWISESVHGEYYFYCKFCKKDYRCSNGKSEVYKHMAAVKHKKNMIQPPSGKNLRNHSFKFRGLLCPVFTPFNRNRAKDINYGLIRVYGKYLKSCGIKGILVNDVVGEGMSLTIEERKKVLEVWDEFCKENNIFLMVQVGGAAMKNVIELATHAEKLNVGALVLLPDLYHRPRTHLDLIRYVKIVADSIGSTPILYHHHPKHTHLDIDMKLFLLDITGEVDTFAGLIYSSADLDDTLEVMELNPDKFIVFMGTDEGMLGATASGFTCIMGKSVNILPRLAESICSCMRNGEVNSAKAAQDLLRKTTFNIYNFGETIPALKAAMAIISAVPMEVVREPLQTVWEGNMSKMRDKLHEIGII